MIVRNPTPGEVDRAAEVAFRAFPDSKLEEWQREFHLREEMFGLRYILIIECDSQIVSSLLCSPAPVWVNGRLVSHSAVGGVGTLPEFRNRGCAGLMMTECVRMLRDEGICLSSLWPFSYEYYRKFGWEIGIERRDYGIPGTALAPLAEGHGVREATADDFPLIAETYRRLAPAFTCMTERSDEWWLGVLRAREQLALDTEFSKRAVICEDGGRVVGYAVYQLREMGDKLGVSIRELMADSLAIRLNILAHLARLDEEREIRFSTTLEDSFLHLMPNPRLADCAVVPSFQFRLIDPVKALESRFYGDGGSARVSLRVEDPVFTEGFDVGLDVEDGRAAIVPADPATTVEVSVQTLAQLYTGYTTPALASELGLLRFRGDAGASLIQMGRLFGPVNTDRTGLEIG